MSENIIPVSGSDTPLVSSLSTGANAPLPVHDAASLAAALATAADGSVIQLAGGQYGELRLSDYNVNVTLLSDPADPAVFSLVRFEQVQGITFDGVVFDYTFREGEPDYYRPFRFTDCQDITLQNSLVDGDLAHGRGDEKDGYGTATGLRFERCANIEILNNEVRGFRDNIQLSAIDNLLVANNEIHHMREDAIEFGSVTNGLFENNYMHNTSGYPLPEGAPAGSGDHPDFFQINSGGAHSHNGNLTFRGNLMDQGSGTTAQGIFLPNRDGVPWKNITIEDNIYINGRANGIVVGQTDGLVVTNNAILHAFWDTETSFVPSIKLDHNSTNAVVTGNLSGTDGILKLPETWVTADNFVVQSTDPLDENYYADHFISISGPLGGHSEKFMLYPDSPLHLAGAGSSHLYPENAEEAPKLIARALARAGAQEDIFIFDASMSSLPALELEDPGSSDAGTVLLSFDAAGGDILRHAADGTEVALDLAPGPIDLRSFDSTIGIWRDDIAPLLDATSFRIDMTLERYALAPVSVAGEVMRLDRAFQVYVTHKGEIDLRLKTTDGTWHKLRTEGAGLADMGAHDISILYSEGHSLHVLVDGAVLAQTTLGGPMDDGIGSRLTIAGQYGAVAYGGLLQDISVSLDVPTDLDGSPLELQSGTTGIPAASGSSDDASSAPEGPEESPEPAVETGGDGYTFVWNFADGTEMEGLTVSRSFDEAGYHSATLTVTGTDGSTDTSFYTVGVVGSDLLRYDSDAGAVYALSYGEEKRLLSVEPGAIALRDLDSVIRIDREEITRMLNSEEFRIDMTLSADLSASDNFAGEVIRLDRAFQVNVTNGGEIKFRLKTTDGTWHSVTTQDAGLNDGASHDLSILFESDEMLQLVLDGEVIWDTDITGELSPGVGKAVVIGGQYGAIAYAGNLEALFFGLEIDQSVQSDLLSYATDMLLPTADNLL